MTNEHPSALPALTPADFGLTAILGCEPVIENGKDGTLLGLVPEGEFLAGGKGADEGAEPFKVRLPAYYLALHPVTNAQYARFLSASGPVKAELDKWLLLDSDCFVRAQGNGYEAYGEKDDHPVVQVSWYGAEAYCVVGRVCVCRASWSGRRGRGGWMAVSIRGERIGMRRSAATTRTRGVSGRAECGSTRRAKAHGDCTRWRECVGVVR